jgi:hypothetical protein
MATTAELIPQVRFFLGNLSTTAISDADMTIIIDGVLVTHATGTDCDQLYYSVVDTLRWLIRQESGESGGLKTYEEKEGNVTIKQDFSVDASDKEAGWSKVLSDLLAAPYTIGCAITPVVVAENSGMVIIGTSVKEPVHKTTLNFRCGGKRNINRHWC